MISDSGVFLNKKPINFLTLEGENLDQIQRIIKPELEVDHYEEDKFGLYFILFKIYYKRKYSSSQEERQKFAIFKKNLELINSTNAKKQSFRTHINKFADTDPTPLKGSGQVVEIPEEQKEYFPENGLLETENEEAGNEHSQLVSKFEQEIAFAFGQNGIFGSKSEEMPKLESEEKEETFYKMDDLISQQINQQKTGKMKMSSDGKSSTQNGNKNKELEKDRENNFKEEQILDNFEKDDKKNLKENQSIFNLKHFHELENLLPDLKTKTNQPEISENLSTKTKKNKFDPKLIKLTSKSHKNIKDIVKGILKNDSNELEIKNPILIISKPEKVSIIKDKITNNVTEIKLSY